ncbi:MAG: DUF1152 domain-containing protein [Acidobacteriota bacterium]
MLNQPVDEILKASRRVLLAGAGGGYDVLGAVPLWVELSSAGKEVFFASLSFSSLNEIDGAIRSPDFPNLYEVTSDCATMDAYCPEGWLACWLENRLGQRQSIWSFERTGARPLHQAYEHLVSRFNIDAIVLIDGGIDAILRGDEFSIGTPEEDLTSLAAVNQMNVSTKILACVGLSAEIRDQINHAQVFERMAKLARTGGYLGAAALVKGAESCRMYREAVDFVFAGQKRQRRSHVHSTIIKAINGRFGQEGPFVWLSPLLNMYWFFSLDTVAREHLFLKSIVETETMDEVSSIIRENRYKLDIKEKEVIPI